MAWSKERHKARCLNETIEREITVATRPHSKTTQPDDRCASATSRRLLAHQTGQLGPAPAKSRAKYCSTMAVHHAQPGGRRAHFCWREGSPGAFGGEGRSSGVWLSVVPEAHASDGRVGACGSTQWFGSGTLQHWAAKDRRRSKMGMIVVRRNVTQPRQFGSAEAGECFDRHTDR